MLIHMDPAVPFEVAFGSTTEYLDPPSTLNVFNAFTTFLVFGGARYNKQSCR